MIGGRPDLLGLLWRTPSTPTGVRWRSVRLILLFLPLAIPAGVLAVAALALGCLAQAFAAAAGCLLNAFDGSGAMARSRPSSSPDGDSIFVDLRPDPARCEFADGRFRIVEPAEVGRHFAGKARRD